MYYTSESVQRLVNGCQYYVQTDGWYTLVISHEDGIPYQLQIWFLPSADYKIVAGGFTVIEDVLASYLASRELSKVWEAV